MIFVFLTSRSMIISRAIHVATNGIISFFLMAEKYSIVYMYHSQGGRVRGKDRLGVWGWHVHTAVFKLDNQQGPTV